MRKISSTAVIAWVLAGCGAAATGNDATSDGDVDGGPRFDAGGTPAHTIAGLAAAACPGEEEPPGHHPAGIDYWELAYPGAAVSVCRGWDCDSGHCDLVATVQVVNLAAGARMRVISELAPGWSAGTHNSQFNKRTAAGWYDWTKANVSSPPGGRLFSVANGSFFKCNHLVLGGCFTGADNITALSFPQKKWNTITSLGAEARCYPIDPDRRGKRLFALSAPYNDRQLAYIDTYYDNCQSDAAFVAQELSTYQGRPASLFDATVGLYPTYGEEDELERRTFIGTRNLAGRWSEAQDVVYLLTSATDITVVDARAILADDFGAMYTMQLDSGDSTQLHACSGGCSSEGSYRDAILSWDWLWLGERPIPEVLAVYDVQ